MPVKNAKNKTQNAPAMKEKVNKTSPKKDVMEATAAVAAPKKTTGLTIDVFDLKGGKTTMTLPSEVFGVKINKTLLAQAVRVYLANQRVGAAKAQTRGEVTGSTRKIYQQKGTGRARHGGIRAPIFVGGGAAHGPRLHDFSLSMPKKMRKSALFSALTSKKEEGSITIVKGLETLEAKTKAVVDVMNKIGLREKKQSVMLVMPASLEKAGNILKAARNIEGVTLMPVTKLNTYEVLKARTILFMQDAIETLEAVAKEK